MVEKETTNSIQSKNELVGIIENTKNTPSAVSILILNFNIIKLNN